MTRLLALLWANNMLHKLLRGRCWCPSVCEKLSYAEYVMTMAAVELDDDVHRHGSHQP